MNNEEYTFYAYSRDGDGPIAVKVIADQRSTAWVAAAEQCGRMSPVIVKIEFASKKPVKIVTED